MNRGEALWSGLLEHARSLDPDPDLANLALLCSHHHRFVHDRGWEMRPVTGRPGRWTFHARGSDTPLEAVRPMPGASADALAEDMGVAPPPLASCPGRWAATWASPSSPTSIR